MTRLLATMVIFALLPASAHAFSYATGGCAAGGCGSGEDWEPTNGNEIDTALDALEARDTVAEHESLETINVILETEMDASSELRALIDDESGTGAIIFAGGAIGAATADTALADDNDTSVATTAFVQTELSDLLAGAAVVLDTDIGVTVQALDADLTDLADGSLSGSKIGTGLDITTATAGTLATARMDSGATLDSEWDTAAEINSATTDDDFVTTTGTHDLEITGSAVFTGTLQGLVAVTLIAASSSSPTADSMRGAMFFCTNGSGCNVSLPAAVAGMNACFYSTTSGTIILDPDVASSDEIRLDGALLGDGVVIDSAGAPGDFVCILAANANEWVTLGRSGTFVESGAD